MFWCKTFSVKGNFVVAICDKDLLGKEIGKKMKIIVSKSFYGGEIIDDKRAIELIKRSSICNLLGKDIIKLAIEKRFITKKNIMFIDDIPHAQIIR